MRIAQHGRVLGAGRGSEADYERAAWCYQRAAEKGLRAALRSLACCYEVGRGVERDPLRAWDLYKKAAAAGDPVAHLNLGTCTAPVTLIKETEYVNSVGQLSLLCLEEFDYGELESCTSSEGSLLSDTDEDEQMSGEAVLA